MLLHIDYIDLFQLKKNNNIFYTFSYNNKNSGNRWGNTNS